jgi:integrase/recombinase XerD
MGRSQHAGTEPCSWDEAVSRFLAARRRKNLRSRTLELDRENLNYLGSRLAVAGYPPSPQEVTTEDLERLIDALLSAKRAGRTVNMKLNTWRLFFRYLLDSGLVDHDPTVRLPRLREDTPAVPHLSRDQYQRLLATAAGERGLAAARNLAMVSVILDTGIRLAGLLRLPDDALDPEEQVLRVPAGALKPRQGAVLPLRPETVRAILAYQRAKRQAGGQGQAEVLFLGDDGLPLSRYAVWRALARLGRAAGIRTTVRPHVLRHTFAVQYICNGGDPFSLQELLGHSTLEMVSRYVQLARAEVARLHDRASPMAHADIGARDRTVNPDRAAAAVRTARAGAGGRSPRAWRTTSPSRGRNDPGSAEG